MDTYVKEGVEVMEINKIQPLMEDLPKIIEKKSHIAAKHVVEDASGNDKIRNRYKILFSEKIQILYELQLFLKSLNRKIHENFS